MPIVVNGTTLTDGKVGNTDITQVYARNGETGTYILVFEKGGGGGTTMALFFGGNWKMNKLKADIDTFFDTFNGALNLDESKKVVIFPPACYLDYAKSKISSNLSNMVSMGIQFIGNHANGAYTGQISAAMAKDCGCTYALIGEMDTRQFLSITDENCNAAILLALSNNLKVIYCVGEPLEVREAGTQNAYIANQLKVALASVTSADIESGKLIFAYQPIWAVGTGKTCSPEDAQVMCDYIRQWFATNYTGAAADNVEIIYGHTVKPTTVNGYVQQQDINGAITAAPSLTATTFADIINTAEEI